MPRVVDKKELEDFLKKNFSGRLDITNKELEAKIIEEFNIISTPAIKARIRAMLAFGYLTKINEKVYRMKERDNATSQSNEEHQG